MVTRKRKFTALPVPFSFGHHFIIREACHSKESKRTRQSAGFQHSTWRTRGRITGNSK